MAGGAVSGGSAASDTYAEARQWLLVPSWLVLGIFVLAPVCVMVIYSFLTKEFRGGVIWDPTLAAYDQFFFDRGCLATVTRIAMDIYQHILAFDLAGGPCDNPVAPDWFSNRLLHRHAPFSTRTLWVFLITIPYWVNLLIRTVSMKFLLRDEGPLNDFLMNVGLINDPLHIINTNLAVQLGLFYSYLPFMVLPIYASVERYNFTLSEAAADLYATKWTTLRRILLPAVKPGVIAGCILVFVPSLGAFLAPDLLGGAKNFMIGSLIEEQFKATPETGRSVLPHQ